MEEKLKEKFPKNYKIVAAISVFAMIAVVFSVSFAYFKTQVINISNPFETITGKVELNIDESNVASEKLLPILDSTKDTKALINDFNIKRTNDSNLEVCYDVYLVINNISESIKNSEYIKYELDYNGGTIIGNFANVEYRDNNTAAILLLNNQYLSKTDIVGKDYTFKIWMSYDSSVDQTHLLKNSGINANLYAAGYNGTCS